MIYEMYSNRPNHSKAKSVFPLSLWFWQRYVFRRVVKVQIILISIGLFGLYGCSLSTGKIQVGSKTFCTTVASCVNSIKEEIKGKWVPPSNCAGQLLVIEIKIYLSLMGTIEEIKVMKSSGSQEFDKSVIVAINYASPFEELMNPSVRNFKNLDPITLVFNAK